LLRTPRVASFDHGRNKEGLKPLKIELKFVSAVTRSNSNHKNTFFCRKQLKYEYTYES